MKKKIRILAIAIVCLMFAASMFLLASCGDKNENTDQGNTDNNNESDNNGDILGQTYEIVGKWYADDGECLDVRSDFSWKLERLWGTGVWKKLDTDTYELIDFYGSEEEVEIFEDDKGRYITYTWKRYYDVEPEEDVKAGDIEITSVGEYLDGVARIFYNKDNVDYAGLVNSRGEIVYSNSNASSIVPIGKGVAIVQIYENLTKCIEVKLINSEGETLFSVNDGGLSMIGYGDGYAMLYSEKTSIVEQQCFYGVINSKGEWVYELTDLGHHPIDEYARYAGDGMFAFRFTYDNDIVFLNTKTGRIFTVTDATLSREIIFIDGTAFLDHKNSGEIYYDADESTKADLPKYCILNTDGTYSKYNMDGKVYMGYSNGYLYYYTGLNDKLYIENLLVDNPVTVSYNEYPAQNVISLTFDGDYALVQLVGMNRSHYITVINKNGEQMFDPIKTGYTVNASNRAGIVYYSCGVVVYENENGQMCICDNNGNVIVTEYDFLEKFSENMTAVTKKDDNTFLYSTLCFVDINGTPLFTEISEK